jgi:hypothetical protein
LFVARRYVTQALSSWGDLAVEKVFRGSAFDGKLCSPMVYGIVPFSAYIVLQTLSKDTEQITKATKRHIKTLA